MTAIIKKILKLPRRVINKTRRTATGEVPSPIINLKGDRQVEWSSVAASIPDGPGVALDFGPGGSYLGLIAAQRGFDVTAVDLDPIDWVYVHPRLRMVKGDILELSLPDDHFDLVINCSTVEHVGIVGRYGVTDKKVDGDLEAMSRLRSLMKPSGVMILTIPVGQDAVFAPLHRIYGTSRLPLLLHGFTVEKSEFWVKNDSNRWIVTDEIDALERVPRADLYGLACFILKRQWGSFG